MAFKEDIQKLISQIIQRKNYITNEEMTKHSLIIPFIQILGYDIFNPLAIKPEYSADFGKKKGEKVDYAVFRDNNPIMFIEAKSPSEKLENHDAQLSRYFNSTPEVKLGIITNGIKYKFFTDLNESNVMDSNPFFELNLENINDNDIDILQKFTKDFFDLSNMLQFAEELVYMSKLIKNLKELFRNPSDEFIRLLVKDFSDSRVTANVIERFKPLVKKAVTSALLEIVSHGILQSENISENASEEINNQQAENNDNDNEITNEKAKIITTEEELKSFKIITNILTNCGKDISNLKYKDTCNYFGVLNKNILGWFLRINLDANVKHLTTKLSIETAKELAPDFKIDPAPKGMGESRITISSYKDIEKLDLLIIKCYEEVESI